jgi:hypothetical protein
MDLLDLSPALTSLLCWLYSSFPISFFLVSHGFYGQLYLISHSSFFLDSLQAYKCLNPPSLKSSTPSHMISLFSTNFHFFFQILMSIYSLLPFPNNPIANSIKFQSNSIILSSSQLPLPPSIEFVSPPFFIQIP